MIEIGQLVCWEVELEVKHYELRGNVHSHNIEVISLSAPAKKMLLKFHFQRVKDRRVSVYLRSLLFFIQTLSCFVSYIFFMINL